ncbi:alkyl sulfatase BDS1-like metallo-beta-lactamase superfamily hydrolase [Rhizobium pusense]|nr:alkyl sulfatase BDS1-like metallo-beta-lactamase superfamily hydrolase [Agrobacterium pusense]
MVRWQPDSPLTDKQRAEKLIALVGGTDKLLKNAQDALGSGEAQWAAEQADHLLAVDGKNSAALDVKIKAFRELGERQMNATARNYYLTVANSLKAERATQE